MLSYCNTSFMEGLRKSRKPRTHRNIWNVKKKFWCNDFFAGKNIRELKFGEFLFLLI